MMHRVDVFTHYFFVPNRLIWNKWEDFITKGVDGTDSPVFPTYSFPSVVDTANAHDSFGDGSLWDYLGLPSLNQVGEAVFQVQSPNGVKAPVGFKVSALPFRAYHLIYNEYYRDQNLTSELEFTLDSGNYQLPVNSSLFGNFIAVLGRKTILPLPFLGYNVVPRLLFRLMEVERYR